MSTKELLKLLAEITGETLAPSVSLAELLETSKDGEFRIYVSAATMLVVYKGVAYAYDSHPLQHDENMAMNLHLAFTLPETMKPEMVEPFRASLKPLSAYNPEHVEVINRIQENEGGFKLWLHVNAEQQALAQAKVDSIVAKLKQEQGNTFH